MDTHATRMPVECLREEIKKIVSRITRIDSIEFEDNVLIREELGIDSLMITEILANIEKLIGIPVDETMFVNAGTVGDFLNLVINLNERKPA